MSLTDVATRNAKPKERAYKLADAKSLYLHIQPTGAKYWRWDYSVDGKRKTLALGVYPETGLELARQKMREARDRLKAGGDPGARRKADKLAKTATIAETQNTFRAIALELIERKRLAGKADGTLSKLRWYLLDLANPLLGERPIGELRARDVLACLKTIEAKGHYETAKKARIAIGQVFRLAMLDDRASGDPTVALRGDALIPPKVTPRAAVVDPTGFAVLLKAIDGYRSDVVRTALQLGALLFQRPGELRKAEWAEFDLDKAVWHVPAERMKMRRPHRVPLPVQAVTLLRFLHKLTGERCFLFASAVRDDKPISENTVNGALRSLGYDGKTATAHGFRATASTILNETGKFSPDVIEASQSRADTHAIRSIYNRNDYFDDRARLHQYWADYLDTLRAGANAVPLHKGSGAGAGAG